MPPEVLKPSYLEIHRMHEYKNIPPFRYLITIATDYLSYLISFSNCDNTTVDYIIVHYEATHLTSDTGNSKSGTDIYSETA